MITFSSSDEMMTYIDEISPRVLIIDGRSGAGKTNLAELLAPVLGANTLHMDDLYRGWDGLAAAPQMLARALADAAYLRYDWLSGSITEKKELDRTQPLIIEGCGSLSQGAIDAAQHFVQSEDGGVDVMSAWIECPEPVRKARALNRDGDMFRPFWDSWASQEDALLIRENPRQLANIWLSTGQTPSTLDECSKLSC